MTPQKKLGRTEFIFLVAALMALNSLAMDIMLPALPDIGHSLNMLQANNRSLVLTFFSIGFGFTQIIFGSLGDRFGRRIPLFIGLTLYIVSAFAAILSPNFETLLFLRMVQGMGAAGVRVMVMAVVRDQYSGNAMAQIMSLVIMIFMLMPILAPVMGQTLLLIGSWHLIFLFMVIAALCIALWSALRLPETLAIDKRRSLTIGNLSAAIKIVFTNRTAMGYSIAGMFMMGTVLGFVNTAQQVFVGIFDLGLLFPIAFASAATMQSMAGFLNSRFVRKFGMRLIAHTAILLFITISSLLWFISLFGSINFWVYIIMMSFIMFTLTGVMSNTGSMAIESLGDVAGTASGVFGTFNAFGGACLGYLINQAFDGSITPLAASIALMGLAALSSMLFAEKGKLFNKPTTAPQP